jgi:hypothetical protein
MAVEIEAPMPVACPPHYWLIEKLDLHHQHWTCQRCGAEQDHQDQHKLLTHRADSRSTHRKASSPLDSPG